MILRSVNYSVKWQLGCQVIRPNEGKFRSKAIGKGIVLVILCLKFRCICSGMLIGSVGENNHLRGL